MYFNNLFIRLAYMYILKILKVTSIEQILFIFLFLQNKYLLCDFFISFARLPTFS